MRKAFSGSRWQGAFKKMLNEIVEGESRMAKDVMGFTLPKTDYGQTKTIIEQNLMISPADIRFLPGSIAPGPYNKSAGEILSFNDRKDLTKLDIDKISSSKVIAIPGLGGGDTLDRASQSLSQFKRLFPEAILYSPLLEGERREDRYLNGLYHYQNEDAINQDESENFFKKVISPKILDENGKLLPPEAMDRFSLVGFSIGSREIKSHINYLFEFLLKHDVEKPDIQKYLDKISVVNIGSPINWSNHKASYSPFILNILSVTDQGTRKPDEVMRGFYLDSKSHLEEASLFHRPFAEKGKDCAVILGNDAVPNGKIENGVFVPNLLGHNLSGYIEALLNASDPVKKLLDLQRSFTSDCGISGEQFKKESIACLKGAREFEYDRELKEHDVKNLLKSWSSYTQRELAQKDRVPFVKKVKSEVMRIMDPESDYPGSVCSTRDGAFNLKTFVKNKDSEKVDSKPNLESKGRS